MPQFTNSIEYTDTEGSKVSLDGTTSVSTVDASTLSVANATNAETATAVPATLIPDNTDINTYRGENYWGKTFYAGGNNSVQNLPYSYGAGFSLEVLKSGSNSTIQRLSAMTSEGNNIPTIYTRSVTDVVTGDGTWSEWQEVAEANGTYPKMKVGEAQRLSMRANVSGAGQLGWYKLGTVTVERLKAIQNTNASYSLFMLVNGANPSGTNISAARSGIIEIDTVVVDGQFRFENGYTAIKALCGNIDVNDFAVAIDSAGTTLTVYMDARENGGGTRTAFSVISEVYGALSGSAFEFGWAFYGATAPADAVYAVVRNNASGDEDGNNIKATYVKQSGTYSNMTVGKATNATNIIPDENGAVNPLGRKADGAVGTNSTALGSNTNASGTNSTALGFNSNASGGYSTASGTYSTASGTYSTALGFNSNASDMHSTALGNNSTASDTNSTALGDYSTALGTYSTALGDHATTSATDSHTMQLGSTSLSTLRCKVNLTVTSDERDKTDISDITNALAFLDKLNPVTFVSNDRTNYISESDKESETFRKYGMCEYDRVSHAAGTKKGKRRRCGLLAQEVVEAMQSVYGTDNYANVVNDNFHDLAEKPSDVENKYTLAYANLVPFLIGAIKELNAKIKVLEGKLVTPSGASAQED